MNGRERADLFSKVCRVLGSLCLEREEEEEAYYFTKVYTRLPGYEENYLISIFCFPILQGDIKTDILVIEECEEWEICLMLSNVKYRILLGFIIVCLSGCDFNYGEIIQEGGNMQKSYKEYAEIFTKYGIKGATLQVVEDLEKHYQDLPEEVILNKPAILLGELGRSDFDMENYRIIPSQNGVYAFDVEVFNIEKMYMDFLLSVKALDQEELDFQNIQEDTSQVNWEEGTGIQRVTFEWKNHKFTLEGEVNNDWFDLSVANKLNEIIKEHGNGKRLFFTNDGYQQFIVLYGDKEWADSFGKETGLELLEVNN